MGWLRSAWGGLERAKRKTKNAFKRGVVRAAVDARPAQRRRGRGRVRGRRRRGCVGGGEEEEEEERGEEEEEGTKEEAIRSLADEDSNRSGRSHSWMGTSQIRNPVFRAPSLSSPAAARPPRVRFSDRSSARRRAPVSLDMNSRRAPFAEPDIGPLLQGPARTTL